MILQVVSVLAESAWVEKIRHFHIDRVLNKLKTDTSSPPTLSEFEVWEKIKAAKKPKSGVPGELPSSLVKEFSVELASPLETIINNIVKTAEWPQQWKLEYVTPIGKTTNPESEDDLRPISLTPFCSKVTEHFVVLWLLEYIEHLIDFRQYGGIRGNSICHYLIELVNFILSNQESKDPTAILACMIDFQPTESQYPDNQVIRYGGPCLAFKPGDGFPHRQENGCKIPGGYLNPQEPPWRRPTRNIAWALTVPCPH